jgi:hypothetical protein
MAAALPATSVATLAGTCSVSSHASSSTLPANVGHEGMINRFLPTDRKGLIVIEHDHYRKHLTLGTIYSVERGVKDVIGVEDASSRFASP